MKFLIAASALVAMVAADFNQIVSSAGDADDGTVGGGERGFGSFAAVVTSMNGKGCWCYFDEDVGSGKGKPSSALDELCKTLHNGYECAMRDAEDEGDSCTPWEVTYTVGSGQAGAVAECTATNAGNNCATRACIVEQTFVAGLVDFFILQQGSISVLDGPFDCSTASANTGVSAKSCCGSYPDRFPFRTNNGDRACCGTRTYNTQTLSCCDADSSSVKFNC